MIARAMPSSQRNAISAAATTAIGEKLAVARGNRPVPAGTAGLPPLTGLAKRLAIEIAASAAADMGIPSNNDDPSDLEMLGSRATTMGSQAENDTTQSAQQM